MSAEINDGGPAFPTANHLPGCDHERGCVHECPVASLPNVSGMTLRDWFAGQATEADIEAHSGGEFHPKTGRTYNQKTREQAKYSYADAMIAAREAKP